MAMGCGRQWCDRCREELIHRDNRAGYESSSALGQIISREGPALLSVTDLDLVSRKGLRSGEQLLRLIEQKQPGHTFDENDAQGITLGLLADVIAHAVDCPHADVELDERSGVYVLYGEISAGKKDSRRKTVLHGTQRIVRLVDGESWQFESPEDLFRLLDPQDRQRRREAA